MLNVEYTDSGFIQSRRSLLFFDPPYLLIFPYRILAVTSHLIRFCPNAHRGVGIRRCFDNRFKGRICILAEANASGI